MSLSNQDLESIKTRLGKATAGEWEVEEPDPDDGGFVDVRICMGFGQSFDYNPRIGYGDKEQALKDADFIAHSKQDIEILLGEIERLKKCDWCGSNDLVCGKAWKEERDKLKEESQRYRTALEKIQKATIGEPPLLKTARKLIGSGKPEEMYASIGIIAYEALQGTALLPREGNND